jgi:hypothetical protein
LRRENIDLKNELILFKNSTNSLLKSLNTSVKQIAQVPVLRAARVRSERSNANGDGGEENATMTTAATMAVEVETPIFIQFNKMP